MTEQLSDEDVVSFAKQFYESELRESLEAEHRDEFVTIEPVSRTYYLGSTFSEAVQKAKRAYPGVMSYTLRIGHRAALHLGRIER
jgi:hypothetical protein